MSNPRQSPMNTDQYLEFVGNHTILVLALFMLRHFGQGLMSHIAVTSVNRYYETVRGKASAIVNQGFTLAEATLPISIRLTPDRPWVLITRRSISFALATE